MEGQGGRGGWARLRAGAPPRTVLTAVALLAVLAGACGGSDNPVVVVEPGSSSTEAEHAGTTRSDPTATEATPAEATSSTPSTTAAAVRPTTTNVGDTGATTTSAPASQLATIHGVVSRGGQPASAARLTLVADDGSERVTTADGSGAYRFTDVAPGHYELVTYAESGKTCDAGGCISASWSQRDELTVRAGETLRFDVRAS